MISIIAAYGRNRELGYQGHLPWKLPTDIRHFQQLTIGHTVVMGKSTFDSINKPLPNRLNVVVSHDQKLVLPGCLVTHSWEETQQFLETQETEAFIIGGAGIYALALASACRMHITEVDYSGPADVYFPSFNPSEWEKTILPTPTKSPKDQRSFNFVLYSRK